MLARWWTSVDAWARRTGRPYRTWPQRLLITVNAGLVVLSLGIAATLGVVYAEASDIERVRIGDALAEPPPAGSGQPLNVLMVGVDASAGLDPDDPVLVGRGNELNSDTIMVLRIDPSSGQAAILSFPRDLYVKIPGSGNRKINQALSLGGGTPSLLIQTIWENFQIPVHHYVEVDLAGFKAMVDELGGVPIYFPTAVRDRETGLFIETAGCTVMDGDQALAYVRSRNYYTNIDGRWVLDYSSDLGRISRQQDFIRRALHRAVSSGWRDPGRLKSLLDIAQDNVRLDERLTPGDLLDLAQDFRTFNPDTLDLYSLPVDNGWAGDASVVRLRTKEAQPILDIFRGSAPVDGSSVVDIVPVVQVWNGTETSGLGARATEDARAAGLTIFGRARDSQDGFDHPTTTVRYGPGQEQAALALARRLPGTPLIERDDDLDLGYVLLIAGDDYDTVLDEPRPVEDFQWFLDRVKAEQEAAAAAAEEQPAPDAPASTTTLIGEVPPPPPEDEACG